MKLTTAAALVLITASVSLHAAPAAAHHSFNAFDLTKTRTLAGTVKTIALVNPHGYLEIVVPDAQGRVQAWGLETSAPGQLARQGWTRATLAKGDKVRVLIHPNRDGSTGGELVATTLPNGQTLRPR